MKENVDPLQNALENARISYRQGNHLKTRYWAQEAIKINPNVEEPWLWLAAVSSPHASISYLQKALSINPHSKLARQAMHWAIKRVRLEPKPTLVARTTAVTQPITAIPENLPSTRIISPPKRNLRPRMWIGIFVLLAAISCALVSPALGFYLNTVLFESDPVKVAQISLTKASNTPTPSNTPTITPSPTPTDTPTPTPTNTDTATPTSTETPSPTFTPYPTDTESPTLEPIDYEQPDPGEGGRWIDVDLSDQMTYAYEGDQLVNSFLVSTGTWLHPTVTGQFYIYVKYEYADMAGPGYYLPNVPYVMYFYKGYGLHGTYWHSNFGTPMSHGCINLTIPEAEWLFYWADVGTLVNIHE